MAATAPSLIPKKKNSQSLLAVGVLLLAVAGAGFWFYRTKMSTLTAIAPTSSRPAASSVVQAVTLDPFLANLAGGEGYVKVTMTLSVHKTEGSVEGGKAKSADASAALLQSAIVRDTILGDLSTQTAAALFTAEGKTALKTTLKSDLTAKVPGLALDNIYFTDFLVQQ